VMGALQALEVFKADGCSSCAALRADLTRRGVRVAAAIRGRRRKDAEAQRRERGLSEARLYSSEEQCQVRPSRPFRSRAPGRTTKTDLALIEPPARCLHHPRRWPRADVEPRHGL